MHTKYLCPEEILNKRMNKKMNDLNPSNKQNVEQKNEN